MITSRPGKAAGQANRAHRGFGAGIHQPHFLDRRNRLDDQLGQFAFGFGRSAKTGAARGGFLHRRDHLRMRVPQDHRSPGADVVDVAIAVDVVQIGAFAALEEDRLAAHAAKRAGRAVHAAGHQRLRSGKCGVALETRN